MPANTTLPLTEARRRLFEIAEGTGKGKRYTLTRHGRAKAVLMSAEEFDSWQETVEVMRDFPDLKQRVAEAEADIRTGRHLTYSTLDDVMAKHRRQAQQRRLAAVRAHSRRVALPERYGLQRPA